MIESILMNVLLISPKDPKKPSQLKFLMGGENTYTQSILNHPPKGVSYIYFHDALVHREIEYTSWQLFLSTLIKLRILPPDVGFQCIKLNKKFDLIHCHGYCLKLDGKIHAPVVLSDSSSNYLFLKDYLKWSQKRIHMSYVIRKWIARKLNIFDQNLNLNGASLVVWSGFAKNIHQKLGIDFKKIIVIPPGIEKLISRKKSKSGSINILFIGVWFMRKGGDLLLAAYKQLKRKYPFITLTIVGEVPKNVRIPKDVYHRNYVPRQELVTRIFPKADILVDIPALVEGYGLVVLEAASLGIPAVVSSVCALPELVEDGRTGLVIKPKSIDALTNALEILIINTRLRKKMGVEAKKRFMEKYWTQVTNKMLLTVYQSTQP